MPNSIQQWLKVDERPADHYHLLGVKRFYADRDNLLALIRKRNREVFQFQDHVDPEVSRRAVDLLGELGEAEGVFSEDEQLRAYNSNLFAGVQVAYADSNAQNWSDESLRKWLIDEQHIHPDAIPSVTQRLKGPSPPPINPPQKNAASAARGSGSPGYSPPSRLPAPAALPAPPTLQRPDLANSGSATPHELAPSPQGARPARVAAAARAAPVQPLAPLAPISNVPKPAPSRKGLWMLLGVIGVTGSLGLLCVAVNLAFVFGFFDFTPRDLPPPEEVVIAPVNPIRGSAVADTIQLRGRLRSITVEQGPPIRVRFQIDLDKSYHGSRSVLAIGEGAAFHENVIDFATRSGQAEGSEVLGEELGDLVLLDVVETGDVADPRPLELQSIELEADSASRVTTDSPARAADTFRGDARAHRLTALLRLMPPKKTEVEFAGKFHTYYEDTESFLVTPADEIYGVDVYLPGVDVSSLTTGEDVIVRGTYQERFVTHSTEDTVRQRYVIEGVEVTRGNGSPIGALAATPEPEPTPTPDPPQVGQGLNRTRRGTNLFIVADTGDAAVSYRGNWSAVRTDLSTVTSCYSDVRGGVWLGGEDGLVYLDGLTKKVYGVSNGLPKGRIFTQVFEDSKGRIWAGSMGGGVYIRDVGKTVWRQLTRAEGLAGDYVRAFAEDSQGRIWIGCGQGVSICDGSEFDADAKQFQRIYDVWPLGDEAGSIFLACRTGLLFYGKGRENREIARRSLPGSESGDLCLYLDSRKRCWVGAQGGGLGQLSAPYTKLSDQGRSTNAGFVSQITEDAAGVIWASSHRGLWKYSGAEWSQEETPSDFTQLHAVGTIPENVARQLTR